MTFNTLFFINSILLGIALSMDAFSISIANTLHEPNMRKFKMIFAAFIYAFFQFAMPILGWICVHTISNIFSAFQKFIPWIALILLLYIGIKMIVESLKKKKRIPKRSNRKTNFFNINTSRNRHFNRCTFSRFYNRRIHAPFCFHRLADYRTCYIHHLHAWTSAWKINRTKTFKSRHCRRNYFNRNRNRNIR